MYDKFFKRLFDLIFALILLPIFLLVFIIVGPMIVITDGFPIFYNSQRRGMHGVPFQMYKFRSMKNNAPDIRNEDGSTFNSENDPRITRIGKILRKLSIDEIPQLLNIIKGDMSFVGPRPNLSTKSYSSLDDLRKKRLSVRPGITGYSQAYYRNSISQHEKYVYDGYYVDHISFVLDFKIILKTFSTVLLRKNIYINKPDSKNQS
ncbi:MAG: sugar transferase [Clostridium sp.]|nr:sugar transferase [Clostridium sp.]